MTDNFITQNVFFTIQNIIIIFHQIFRSNLAEEMKVKSLKTF